MWASLKKVYVCESMDRDQKILLIILSEDGG